MRLFAINFLVYFIKLIFLSFIAFCGLYVGYRINHGIEIYFRKQRKQMAKRGKLIAYMNRHYYAVFKKRKKSIKQRNEKWLYEKCCNYAERCESLDIKTAIAYLKSDIKQCEVFSILIAISIGFSKQITDPIAKAIALFLCKHKTDIGSNVDPLSFFNEMNTDLQTICSLLWAVVLILLLINFQRVVKKQQYLLCILEDPDI